MNLQRRVSRMIVKRLKPAFSMLELIFVIVILGIVASIGSELIAKVYSNYIVQRAAHRSSSKTEIAATQIANRLSYAIPNTIIAVNHYPSGPTNKESLESLTDTSATILQWTGYDHDSFNALGWSGLADINTTATTATAISTPGSDLTLASSIMINLNGNMSNAAIFFPRTFSTNNIGYGVAIIGDSTDITGLTKIASAAGGIITLDAVADLTGKIIREHYKISSSAYAIVPVKKDGTTICQTGDFPCDLVLRYNFQPWQGENYNSGNASSKLLISNISAFRFTGSGNTIRFKICQEENIGADYNITTCKEKAVIR